MPCYLVRIKDTHEAVGIFVAADLDQLADLIDEFTNVATCECAKLPSGGFGWGGKAKSIPLGIEEPEDLPASVLADIGEMDLTEMWLDAIVNGGLKYKPVVAG